ncbi:MAG: aminotransferase [Rhodobacteraceae bacterium]|nr:aminotransferase [Paracoccaceae bacterium]
MPITVNPSFTNTFAPPVMESRRWLAKATFSAERPLINVSQAAPVDPPPEPLRQALADAALNEPEAHLYGPVLGLPELRGEVAQQWSLAYAGAINADQVAITSGCNQAFCAAVSTLAGARDEVILPAPWYFNHKMWLDMQGIETRVLMCGDDLLPDPETARASITDSTKAIVLVTPNNPSGAEYPPELIRAFYEVAKSARIALIIDETYRDFHSRTDAPHDLFSDPDWADTLIQLYSFSKAYRLTGHRVGALIGSAARLAEVEKFLDTLTICPNQLGQRGALFGMRNLGDWLAGERLEILDRRAAIKQAVTTLPDWKLKGCGAYFAYVEHPYDMASDALAQKLVQEAAALMLPGTMFAPTRARGGDGSAESHLRIAFANVDRADIHQLFKRLSALHL